MHFFAAISLFSLVVCFIWLLRSRLASSTTLPLPPGPPPKWLVGNLFDIPTRSAWILFTELKKKYDIVCLQALGKSIVVLNTIEAATELLERRSLHYSNRPVMTMAGELMGLNQSTTMLQYDDTWRMHRSLLKSALDPETVKKYVPVQEQIAILYLKTLLERPNDFATELRLTAGRIIMAITYGLSVGSADDDYITEVELVFEKISRMTLPGAYIVDLVPALKHLPVGFPFASFHKEASEGRRQLLSVIERPYEHVKRELAAGRAFPSFTSDLLDTMEQEHGRVDEEAENTIKWVSGTFYGAGGETTYGTIMTFILAMALFPDKQSKAQAEIDSVMNSERIPDIHDRASLPYVTALIKETMRWHVVVPLGFPHVLNKDDEYQGYHIPGGSTVLANVWAISHDEKRHQSPQDFMPERFLKGGPNAPVDPHTYAFGFGRRMCPGHHLAENSIFILISSMLATFRISRKLDKHGNELPLVPVFTQGLISYPEPFECRILPRSSKAAELIISRASAI